MYGRKMSPETRKGFENLLDVIEARIAGEASVTITKAEYDKLKSDSEYLEWLHTAPQGAVDTFRGLW